MILYELLQPELHFQSQTFGLSLVLMVLTKMTTKMKMITMLMKETPKMLSMMLMTLSMMLTMKLMKRMKMVMMLIGLRTL